MKFFRTLILAILLHSLLGNHSFAQQSELDNWALKGIIRIGEKKLFSFRSSNGDRSGWLSIGEDNADFNVSKWDSSTNRVAITKGNDTNRLSLSKTKVAHKPTKPSIKENLNTQVFSTGPISILSKSDMPTTPSVNPRGIGLLPQN